MRGRIVAVVLVVAAGGLAVLAPLVLGDSAERIDARHIAQGPSADHWLGTDAGGRDILARVLVAGRLSVLMALSAAGLGVLAGTVVGSLTLLLGARLGRLVSAAINAVVAFPALLVILSLSVILGRGALTSVIAVGLAVVPIYARIVAVQIAGVAGRDYVAAARLLGQSRLTVLWRHVLPAIRRPLMAAAATTAGSTLIVFAGVSFIGLGVQPPDYDWGVLLSEGVARIYVSPAGALGPGVAVVLAGLAFVVLGETAFRDPPASAVPAPGAPGGEPAEPDIIGAAAPRSGTSTEAVLSVRGLGVRAADGRVLVDGVDLDVEPGEVVGLVGESGSGKSLTCAAVTGILAEGLTMTTRRLRVAGVELGGDEPAIASVPGQRHLGRTVGMVFQNPMSSLNPVLRVRTQLAEPAWRSAGRSRSQARKATRAMLEEVAVPEPERRRNQYPFELSGGLRQRVMIAMGLAAAPALLVADEPTTALDVSVQADVLRLLARLQAERGMAILFVSHDLPVVTALCSRVVIMRHGRVVESVTTEDLLAGRARSSYARDLMAAVPSMDDPPGTPFTTLAEEPATLPQALEVSR